MNCSLTPANASPTVAVDKNFKAPLPPPAAARPPAAEAPAAAEAPPVFVPPAALAAAMFVFRSFPNSEISPLKNARVSAAFSKLSRKASVLEVSIPLAANPTPVPRDKALPGSCLIVVPIPPIIPPTPALCLLFSIALIEEAGRTKVPAARLVFILSEVPVPGPTTSSIGKVDTASNAAPNPCLALSNNFKFPPASLGSTRPSPFDIATGTIPLPGISIPSAAKLKNPDPPIEFLDK